MKSIKFLITPQGLPLTYAIFYLVGLMLFFIPATRPLFIVLTPGTLILAAFSFLVYHPEWKIKSGLVLAFIFISSIGVEALGVATGVIFGSYSYHQGLGLKVAQAPILIGVNWVILVYGSNALARKIPTGPWMRILSAALLMVAFDLIMEFAAPYMQMWSFEGGAPPLRNYIAWFVLGAFYQFLLEIFRINTNNQPARALFLAQFIFFVCIVLYSVFYIA